MRIGIDARFYGSLGKGLGRYTQKLIEHLESCDQENEYIIFLRRENFEEYTPKNKHFCKVLAHYAWYGFGEQILFPFVLYGKNLDLMHFPHFNVPLLYRKKFILTVHDLILLHYPTLRNTTRSAFMYRTKFLAYRLTIASAVRRATSVITVSHFTKGDLLKQYPFLGGKVFVTYEAADAFCLWSALPFERACLVRLGLIKSDLIPAQSESATRDILQPYFLYVGNAYPHKNLELLVDAARFFPDHRFVLVGKEDYFYKRLKQKAVQAGSANVIFAGFASDKDLGILYRNASLYLFPSLYEGFGLPPLEAMNYGVPVLSSNRAALPEILGDSAVFFNPSDASSLCEAIKEMEGNEERASRLRRRGYRRVAFFSWQAMAQQTLDIYSRSKIKTYGRTSKAKHA